MPASSGRLTGRQAAFALLYLDAPTAKAAAIAAGYSRDSAANQAWRLLRRPEVCRRVVELRDRRLWARRDASFAQLSGNGTE